MTTLSSIRQEAIEDAGAGGLDSAQVTAIAGGVGLSVYSTLDNLPTSGLTSGDQAFVSSTNRFYISNGSGWYNVALINATPSLTIDPTGTIVLATDGSTPTVITLTATDSDNPVAALTYSVDSDGNFAGLGTISQDSSVFTITPLSEDSATTGTSTLTFKASDGISFGSGTTTFTLTFITSVENSKYTTLLAKADTAGTDNQVDASTNTHTITEVGNVTSTALSPYHPGGYSTSFDGVSDYLSFTMTSAFNLTGDFTLECWFKPNAITLDTQHPNIIKMGTYQLYLNSASNFVGVSPDGVSITLQSANSSIALNTWYHVAIVRSGSSEAMFLNGTRVDTNTASTVYGASSGTSLIGTYSGTGGDYNGAIRDLRLVNGTAIYNPSETTISTPTKSLTAVANTSLLTCHLPYIADGSSNNHTLTVNGNVSTERFAPYDYEAYTKAEHGGSLDFQTASDYMAVDAGAITSSWGNNFTIEFWLHRDALNDGTIFDNRIGAQYPGFFINAQSNGVAVYAQSWLQSGIGNGSDYLGKWAHYALTFSGTEGKSFVNGKLTHTYTIPDTATYAYHRTQNTIGAKQYVTRGDQALGQYKAKLADFRISTVLRYTTDFTPPTTAFVSDADTLLLTCTNKNSLWDASKGDRVIKTGTISATNTNRYFSTSSAIYHAGGANNVQFYADDRYTIGTQDFTMEVWARFDTVNGGAQTLATYSNAAGFTGGNDYQSFWIGLIDANSYFITQTGASSWSTVQQGSSDISANTWYHFALTRASGTVRQFVNGNLVGSSYTNNFSLTNSNNYISFMGRQQGSQYMDGGYIQDPRLSIGVARYTANFTPPTAEFAG